MLQLGDGTIKNLSETKQRVIIGALLAVIGVGIAMLQYYGIHAVRWAMMAIVVFMWAEAAVAISRAPDEVRSKNWLSFAFFGVLLLLCVRAAYTVGNRPWIVLLLLMTICAADIGAWLFGRIIGGDKMWERLSAGKTWSGQIAGIICGTAASVLYGLLGTDTFMPQLMWIGISVALLSQYGDLTASMVKRKLGIKDFGHLLPGHGGVLDRFDGWIYVLPLVWLVMM